MSDPLSEVITLLKPRTIQAKCISGAGKWGLRYSEFGQPSFSTVLEGSCKLAVDGSLPITLKAGDFILLPTTPAFTISGFKPVRPVHVNPKTAVPDSGEVRHGTRTGPPDVRMLGGYFVFDSPDSALLVSLLPTVLHLHGVERLSLLARMIAEESIADKPGKELVLSRLVEVLLIEALRANAGDNASPGLLRGLADPRIAPAMRQMHSQLSHSWTVSELAKAAALSRSAFFERFSHAVGLPPMEYLLSWRMAVARNLLGNQELGISQVAEQIGYGSASAFSTAFTRYVGQPPSVYARSLSA